MFVCFSLHFGIDNAWFTGENFFPTMKNALMVMSVQQVVSRQEEQKHAQWDMAIRKQVENTTLDKIEISPEGHISQVWKYVHILAIYDLAWALLQ